MYHSIIPPPTDAELIVHKFTNPRASTERELVKEPERGRDGDRDNQRERWKQRQREAEVETEAKRQRETVSVQEVDRRKRTV